MKFPAGHFPVNCLRPILASASVIAIGACASAGMRSPVATVTGLDGRAPQITATPGATTVVVVRHAEKSTDDPRDPTLNAAGQERARLLTSVLKTAGVTDIYTTQYKRTRQTAEPLAQQLGIAIVERPASAANAATYARDLAQEILAKGAGKGVLVVGHSNTVPDIVEALSGATVPAITDPEYDHIFVVVIPASGSPRLLPLRFGRANP